MKAALLVFVIVFGLVYVLGSANTSPNGKGFIDAFKAIDVTPEKVEGVKRALKDVEAFHKMKQVNRTFRCPYNSGYPEAEVTVTRTIVELQPPICDFHGDGTQIIDGKEGSFTFGREATEEKIVKELERAGVPAPVDFDGLCDTFIEVDACGISNR